MLCRPEPTIVIFGYHTTNAYTPHILYDIQYFFFDYDRTTKNTIMYLYEVVRPYLRKPID